MAGKTRGKGEGSIYQRADGYWVGQVEAGRCTGGHARRDGTRCPGGERRRSRIVRRYKAEIVNEIGRLKTGARSLFAQRIRVDPYLDYWLSDVIAGEVAASTLAEYTKQLARVRPTIGHLWLDKLGKAHIQDLANDLTDRYARKTRNGTLGTLKQALQWAVPEWIDRNPAEGVKGPKKLEVRTDDTMTADEAHAVEAQMVGDRYEALYWLALNYGLRIGELLALNWPDIAVADWDTDAVDDDELTVVDAKTEAGIRTLPLTPDAKRQLAAHRVATIAAGRLPVGPTFVGPAGGRLKAQRVREWYSAILARAGITHRCRNCGTTCTHAPAAEGPCRRCRCSSNVRRFHSSRHTAATLLLEAGVHLEVVSAILGHANIGITASIYAKVRADLKRKGLAQR